MAPYQPSEADYPTISTDIDLSNPSPHGNEPENVELPKADPMVASTDRASSSLQQLLPSQGSHAESYGLTIVNPFQPRAPNTFLETPDQCKIEARCKRSVGNSKGNSSIRNPFKSQQSVDKGEEHKTSKARIDWKKPFAGRRSPRPSWDNAIAARTGDISTIAGAQAQNSKPMNARNANPPLCQLYRGKKNKRHYLMRSTDHPTKKRRVDGLQNTHNASETENTINGAMQSLRTNKRKDFSTFEKDRSIPYLTRRDLDSAVDVETLHAYSKAYVEVRKPQIQEGHIYPATPEEHGRKLVQLQKVLVLWLVFECGLFSLLRQVTENEYVENLVASLEPGEEEELEELFETTRFAFVSNCEGSAMHTRYFVQWELGQQGGDGVGDCGNVDEILVDVVTHFVAECQRIAQWVMALRRTAEMLGAGVEGVSSEMLVEGDTNEDVCEEVLGHSEEEIGFFFDGDTEDTG